LGRIGNLLSVFLKISDDVGDRDEALNVVILDLKSELLLAEKDQVGKLKGIDAKVIDLLGLELDVVSVDLQVVYQHGFYFLKHGGILR
jgi:hypothetical protein